MSEFGPLKPTSTNHSSLLSKSMWLCPLLKPTLMLTCKMCCICTAICGKCQRCLMSGLQLVSELGAARGPRYLEKRADGFEVVVGLEEKGLTDSDQRGYWSVQERWLWVVLSRRMWSEMVAIGGGWRIVENRSEMVAVGDGVDR
ncbi:unnamed protein product [Dovyalis caffra]|uniref:Uncharacterized protein n=1 Tax=Dovyalis caffra TaxID=77055 RepID=A0AAV1QVJ6_9ROSI|nr:unnamed protein product [Dovyalis caffra]